MKTLDVILYKFKIAVRTKELYFYIIGFPLIFMLIYGSFAYTAYAELETIDLGYINMDEGIVFEFGNINKTYVCGETYREFLSTLKYNQTNKPIYNIINYTDIHQMKNHLLLLKIDAGIVVPENFSANVLEFSKSIIYSGLINTLSRGLQEAQNKGNMTLIQEYLEAIEEIQELQPSSFRLEIKIMGDPTYSKAMYVYEYSWRHIMIYVSKILDELTRDVINYLESKYDIDLSKLKEDSTDITSSLNIEFEAIGTPGVAKKSFAKLYFSVLVPGQIMQSIIIGAVSAIYMVGYDIERNLLDRLRLTRITPKEYIIGILLSWGIVALFQAAIMLAVAIALGYVEFEGNPINYLLAILILIMAGIISASISLIIVSLAKPQIAGTMSLIVLLVLSLYIAGYFPVPNPTLGTFLGREITLLDLFPWRAGITGLRKSLMLADEVHPTQVLPDIGLLVIWLMIYSTIAIIMFDKKRLKRK